ncbi:sugar ABC transporter ATP-binding protein [Niameybacter massiliensis]|uniref:Sugar ABC transporter ATP-binding protein n=1 Tax=Holtiella tumoricola TaxID=3018743 RepID=A0AA42DRX6_9FIRM|nr:sugar ABC transporter ATP-binding protein [Holtiella tumoricola]MDA3734005.1 sugar ABC transporter ATP-binding protein [Holtiella tumoricola]
MGDVFLQLDGIKKSFGGVHALKGVDLEVRLGEVHCLAGENGCGKSTLIKVISGVHDATEGTIIIEGKKINKLTPIDAIKMGIQVIYQDFAIFPNLTVAENIAMNQALMTGAKRMDWKKARILAKEAMERIGVNIDPDVLVERLSVANKQIVAICRAIMNDAKLVILDEPTTALTAKEVERLNEIIINLKNKNIAVVIVNHKLDEIYQIAEKLTVLRNGKNVAHGLIEEFDRQRFIKCLTGREIEEALYRPEESKEEILRVEHYTKKGAFEDISFNLHKGDVLGITGLLGSGRGEIGDALFGLAPAESGTVLLNEKKIMIKSVQDAVKHKIAYVPEDRLTQGLFLERSIEDNTIAASVKKYFNQFKLDHAAMLETTKMWIQKIGCVASSPQAPINTLSGGNAQKVVIAKWLNTEPDLIILNGPTVGVDIGAKADIHKILHELASQGVGVIIISDDLSEIIHNCNKVIVLQNGRIVAKESSKDLDEAKLSALLSSEINKRGGH